ncbi:MAG: peptide chain release factor N(5)-glutamine methyltransferase [Alphaproteobacteria bacterium]
MPKIPATKKNTIATLIKQASRDLQKNNIPNPKMEARWLLAHICNIDDVTILVDDKKTISQKNKKKFLNLIKKRSQHIPFAYLLGWKEFFSLRFIVSPAVLIPRPTSENICQTVIDYFLPSTKLSIADLGTGSGCLLLTLLHHFKYATGVGIDISQKALSVAKHNAKNLKVITRVNMLKKNLTHHIILQKKFDVIVANPPYVKKQEYKKLAKDIFFEPSIALIAKDNKKNDGLYFYPLIKKFADSHLIKNGLLVMEAAHGQKKSIEKIFAHSHYKTIIIT